GTGNRDSAPDGVGSWCVVAVWLLCTVGTLFYYEFRDWRPFSAGAAPSFKIDRAKVEQWFRTHVANDTQEFRGAQLTFVHLFNPDCRCDDNAERHLQRLMDRYRSQGVRFVAALPPRYADRPAPGQPSGLS